jgi:hypothetical protein
MCVSEKGVGVVYLHRLHVKEILSPPAKIREKVVEKVNEGY